MKVKKLIAELKKMPQNLDVKYAHHDNMIYEAAGETDSIMLFDKQDYPQEDRLSGSDDLYMFDNMPNQCVIIRG